MPNQTINSLTGRVLDTVDNACHRFEPNMVLIQGDTTTAFASALAAHYCKIAVGHIEAGLRSHDIYNPFPEEANRRLASVLTEIHFAPTALARDNLLAEGAPAAKIVVTGNTVIDTLRALAIPEWVQPKVIATGNAKPAIFGPFQSCIWIGLLVSRK
jgi:UDP-N-acetylglucosamine 2-epimerase (non-hydrolysing)